MASGPKANTVNKPGTKGQWWAGTTVAERAGKGIISYIEAPNESTAQAALGPAGKILGGPYATEAEAEKAFPQGSHGTTTVPKDEGPPTVNAEPAHFSNPLDALGEIAHWLGVGIIAITDKYMWISIGWLLLGLVLLVLGIYVLVRSSSAYESVEGAIKSVAAAAA